MQPTASQAVTKNIEITLLRSFVHVAETGSFTHAGTRANKTQSAISVQIRNLEERLGQRLLDRSGRAVCLTEQGEVLLGYAKQMLRINDEAVHRLALCQQRVQLRLGLVEYLAPHRLPSIVSNLANAFPQYEFSVKIDLSKRLRADLLEGKLDVVIAARDEGDTSGTALFSESLVWATRGASVDADQPLAMAFLPQPCFYREAATKALDAIGRAWVCSVTTMNISGVQMAVNAGLAVGVLGQTSVQPGMTVLGEKHGLPPLPTFQVAVFAAQDPRSAGTEPLIRFLTEAILSPSRGVQ